MPTLELEFEVFCSCGEGLCNNSREGHNRHSQYITVEPCQKCLDRSYEDGVDDGYEKGIKEMEEEK